MSTQIWWHLSHFRVVYIWSKVLPDVAKKSYGQMHPPLLQVIDFPRFEDEFKLGGGEVIEDMTDGTPTSVRRASKRPETVSLLDPNRLRNVGKGLPRPTFNKI